MAGRRRGRPLLAALAVAAAAATAPGGAGSWLEREVGLPWLFRLRGAVEPPPSVVIVAQDRASSEALGMGGRLGGWPRDALARVIGRATEAGARAVALDLMLDLPREAAGDEALAAAIAASRRTVLFEQLEEQRAGPPRPVPPLPALADGAAATAPFRLPRGGSPVTAFQAFHGAPDPRPTLPAAALLVAALAEPGLRDALVRAAREEGMEAVEGPLAGGGMAFATRVAILRGQLRGRPDAAARLAARLPKPALGAEPLGHRLAVAALDLLAGGDEYVLAPYGPAGRVDRVPYARVLEGDPAVLRRLEGRIVFVGASEVEARTDTDTFPTAFPGAADPAGVEIAATACLNLLHGDAVARLAPPATALLAGGTAAATTAAVALLPPPAALAALAATAAAATGAALWALTALGLALPVASAVLLALPLGLGAGLLLRPAARRRRRPRERWAVVLATDLTGYVALAEAWRPRAREFAALLAEYRALIGEVVERHGGRVLDFAGDASMSFWDAPAPSAAVRERAARAALDLLRTLDHFGAERGLGAHPTRGGLAEGGLVLGSSITAGEVLSTAARLEQLNKQLGTRLLATAAVVDGLERLRPRPVGAIALKGRAEPEAVVALEVWPTA